MEKRSRQAGFTLIEVMLFLAITGLLFLIGFYGTGTQIRSVRFTDSMRGLHSYLQKQYGLVSTGANPRQVNANCTFNGSGLPLSFSTGGVTADDTAGDDNDCVLLGRLIKFNVDSGTATSYYVAGRYLSNKTIPALSGDDMTDLANSNLTLAPQGADTYTINWGSAFNQPATGAPNTQTQTIAYLRSPTTGRIIPFAFSSAAVDNSTSAGNDANFRTAVSTAANLTANLAKNSGYCFKDDFNRNAIIKLGYNQRGDALDLAFNGFTPATDCVRSKP